MAEPELVVLAALLRSVADRIQDADVPYLLMRISNEGVGNGLRQAAEHLERRPQELTEARSERDWLLEHPHG